MLTESGRFDRRFGPGQNGRQALSLKPLDRRQLAEINQRGKQVHKFRERPSGSPGRAHSRRADEQGNLRVILEAGRFSPQSVLANLIAVITAEHDHRPPRLPASSRASRTLPSWASM